MANPNAVFGSISDISRDERGITISLTGDRIARLDPGDKRSQPIASVLEDVRRRKMPVYLEVDPASGFVTQVLLPDLVRVESMTEDSSGNVSITFERSHARHIVKRDSADAGELLRALREAGKERWLAVTVNDRAEILDVRPYDPPFELPRPEPPPPRARSSWFDWLFCCVSKTRAQQLFNLCAATTCNPVTVPAPCIPFLYPDDGCWGRAHEMSRLMVNAGATPKKVWIYGSLHTLTKNNPNCFVDWGWHVAPTLCVRKWWLFGTEEKVIDPSLFTTPVSKATWKSVQGDPAATFVSTSWEVFSRWGGDQPDPGFVQTNIVLANYRAKLQLRSINIGPPPYANCP